MISRVEAKPLKHIKAIRLLTNKPIGATVVTAEEQMRLELLITEEDLE
jgi:hypothetical protein